MASMRFNRTAFSTLLLRKFAFLSKECGLRKQDLGAADEFVDRYLDRSTAVTITLSYPELPMVVLATKAPSPISYRYVGLKGQLAGQLKKQYYACLKRDPNLHGKLTEIQVQYADILVDSLRIALHHLQQNPPSSLGAEWLPSARRFPT